MTGGPASDEPDPRQRLLRLRQALAARVRLEIPVPEGFRRSAVLVPLLVDAGPALLFTERHAQLPTHAGQISFPGGRSEPADRDPEDTALRELEEEVGLPGRAVDVLGRLDDVLTPVGFHIVPVVGAVSGTLDLRPSPREVASTFTATLDELRATGCHQVAGTREFAGVAYEMHEYHVGARRVWGATARMVHQLLEAWPA